MIKFYNAVNYTIRKIFAIQAYPPHYDFYELAVYISGILSPRERGRGALLRTRTIQYKGVMTS